MVEDIEGLAAGEFGGFRNGGDAGAQQHGEHQEQGQGLFHDNFPPVFFIVKVCGLESGVRDQSWVRRLTSRMTASASSRVPTLVTRYSRFEDRFSISGRIWSGETMISTFLPAA